MSPRRDAAAGALAALELDAPDELDAAVLHAAVARIPSLGESAVARLRQLILDGALRPDQPLREERLAQVLQVSRGPVREALGQLEREGLVVRRRYRGAVVARMSRRDIEEVYTLRLAQERVAAEYAARTASEADLDTLAELAARFGRAVKTGSENEVNGSDLAFHDFLYRMSRHRRLYDTWALLRPQVYLYLNRRERVTGAMRERAHRGHLELVDALRVCDEVRAVTAAETHIREAYARVVASLPQEYVDESPPLLPPLLPIAATAADQ